MNNIATTNAAAMGLPISRCAGNWLSLAPRYTSALGADEAEIEDSFRAAIRVAKEQKSVSLEKRAEASYAEYRRQKSKCQQELDFDYNFGNVCSSVR